MLKVSASRNKLRGWAIAACASTALAACATAVAPYAPFVAPQPVRAHGLVPDTIVYIGFDADLLAEYLAAQVPLEAGTDWRERQVGIAMSGMQLLRDAGYNVVDSGGVADLDLPRKLYGLRGTVKHLRVEESHSKRAPRILVRYTILWQIEDLQSSTPFYAKEVYGVGTANEPAPIAVKGALDHSLAQLLADAKLAGIIVTGPPRRSVDEREFATAHWRQRPRPSDLVLVEREERAHAASLSTVARAAHSVIVIERSDGGHGSGFIISPYGYALTNYHVVANAPFVYAGLSDGRRFPARVIRSNAAADVALVELACPEDCEAIDIAPILDPGVIGEDVLVLGAPLHAELSHTVTRGIVSGLRWADGVTQVQTDAAVNRGSSGGPIIHTPTGQVIAMVTSKWVGIGVEGLAFGIAIDDALRAVGVRLAGR